MTPADWLLLALWAIYLLDGARWLRHDEPAGSGAPGFGASLTWSRLHFAWPWPWFWRVRLSDTSTSPSPEGLGAAALRSLHDPRPVQAPPRCFRWEELREAREAKGELRLNGARFSKADPVVSAFWIQETAGRPAAERIPRIDALACALLSPARWARRQRVLLKATAAPAAWNAATLVLALGLTTLLFTPLLKLPEATEEKLGAWLLPLAQSLVITYLGGVIAALLAARRLKHWLPRGTTLSLLLSALYPPQGLRWRLRLLEAAQPPVHPLTFALSQLPERERRIWVRRAWTTWNQDAQSGRDPALAAWSTSALARLRDLLPAIPISENDLSTPPKRDGRASRYYCPCCHAQFTHSATACTCGLPLLPLP